MATNSRAAPRRAQAGVPDTGDIDVAWELDAADVILVEEPEDPERARAMMPTLHEEDPLRFDLGYRRRSQRDSMPTLPDIDPLSYDISEDK